MKTFGEMMGWNKYKNKKGGKKPKQPKTMGNITIPTDKPEHNYCCLKQTEICLNPRS